MFLTILHMRYLKAMAEYALLLLLLGAAIFGWATWVAGVTFYLIPAPLLPIVETAIRFQWPRSFTDRKAIVAGAVAALGHAVFLGLAQSGTAEMARFAVISQYLSLVVAGTGVGCMLFTKQILSHKEPKRSKIVGKGKGGYQRPRKSAVKKPAK
jgi:hypothetical protein